MADSLLDQFAGTVRDTSPGDSATTLLADFLACAEAGVRRTGRTADPARLAAAAHADDRDDVHWETLIHCGSIIWPVALSTAATGRAVACAAAAGYEAMVRLGRFLGPAHRRAFHPTSTTGAVGAAATAACARGLPPDAFADALAHAISVMGGSAQTVRERRDTRLFHRAHAVRTGLAAADAAADGWCGTRFGLEALDGTVPRALCGPAPAALAGTAIRLFPTSGWNQAAFDAALQLRGRGDLRAVVVQVGDAVADASTGPDPAPADRAWSLEFAVARALTDDLTAPGLASLVRVERTGGSPLQARVQAGTQVAEVRYPLGHPERPAGEEQLLHKWRHLTGTRAERLLERCHDLLHSSAPVDPAFLTQEPE